MLGWVRWVLGPWILAALLLIWNGDESWTLFAAGVWLLLGAIGVIAMEMDVLHARRLEVARLSSRPWRRIMMD